MKISKEFKIGLSGIIAIAILFVGINFLKGVSMTGSQNRYYVAFDNVRQLAVNSPVYAGGYKVGIVHDIVFDYQHNDKVIVVIDVDGKLRLPKGSTAALESAMLGGCTMHLLLQPNASDFCAKGDTIQGGDMPGLMSQAASLMPDVQSVVSHIDQLVGNLNRIVSDSALASSLGNIEALTANLNSCTQRLDHLLAVQLPQLMSTFDEAGQQVTQLTGKLTALDVEGTLARLDSTVSSLQLVMDKLNRADNNIGLLLNDTALYAGLNNTLNSATSLLEDLRQHPKRYVHFSVFGRKDK